MGAREAGSAPTTRAPRRALCGPALPKVRMRAGTPWGCSGGRGQRRGVGRRMRAAHPWRGSSRRPPGRRAAATPPSSGSRRRCPPGGPGPARGAAAGSGPVAGAGVGDGFGLGLGATGTPPHLRQRGQRAGPEGGHRQQRRLRGGRGGRGGARVGRARGGFRRWRPRNVCRLLARRVGLQASAVSASVCTSAQTTVRAEPQQRRHA